MTAELTPTIAAGHYRSSTLYARLAMRASRVLYLQFEFVKRNNCGMRRHPLRVNALTQRGCGCTAAKDTRVHNICQQTVRTSLRISNKSLRIERLQTKKATAAAIRDGRYLHHALSTPMTENRQFNFHTYFHGTHAPHASEHAPRSSCIERTSISRNRCRERLYGALCDWTPLQHSRSALEVWPGRNVCYDVSEFIWCTCGCIATETRWTDITRTRTHSAQIRKLFRIRPSWTEHTQVSVLARARTTRTNRVSPFENTHFSGWSRSLGDWQTASDIYALLNMRAWMAARLRQAAMG